MRHVAAAMLALVLAPAAPADPPAVDISATWHLNQIAVVRKLKDDGQWDQPMLLLWVNLVPGETWAAAQLKETEPDDVGSWFSTWIYRDPGPYILADGKPIHPCTKENGWTGQGPCFHLYFPLPDKRPTKVDLHLPASTATVERFSVDASVKPDGSPVFTMGGLRWRVRSVAPDKPKGWHDIYSDFGHETSAWCRTAPDWAAPMVKLGLVADGPFPYRPEDLRVTHAYLRSGEKTHPHMLLTMAQPDGKERKKSALMALRFAMDALPQPATLTIEGFVIHLEPDDNAESVIRDIPVPTEWQ